MATNILIQKVPHPPCYRVKGGSIRGPKITQQFDLMGEEFKSARAQVMFSRGGIKKTVNKTL